MNRIKRLPFFRSSDSFFVEMIITILFFALSCSIIVQVLAKAKEISNDSSEQSICTTYLKSFVEIYEQTEDIAQSINTTFGTTCKYTVKENKITVLFNPEWKNTSCQYTFTVDINQKNTVAGVITYLDAQIITLSQKAYTLSDTFYTSKKGVENE